MIKEKKGKGLKSWLKRPMNSLINMLGINKTSIINPIKPIKSTTSYVKTVIGGRDNYPPNARKVIAEFENKNIKSILVIRQPVQSFIPKAFNVITFGQFQKKLDELPYDKLYHLRMVATFDDNQKLQIEKNEVINISKNVTSHSKQEGEEITINKPLTLKELLQGGLNKLGQSKMFSYHPFTNNCQDFIIALLEGSNLLTPELSNFIKQDVNELAHINPFISKIASSLTSLGGKFNEIMHGTGIHSRYNDNYKVQSVLFDKKIWTTTKAKKWLKENNYIASKVDKTDNFLRFRQLDPNDYTKPQWRYTTHRLADGIDLIILYKNISSNNQYMPKKSSRSKIVLSDSDSDSDTSIKSIKKSKGRGLKPKNGDLIHIDIDSHNAKNKSKMEGKGDLIHIDLGSHNAKNKSKMKGEALVHEPHLPADYRLQDYNEPMRQYMPLNMTLKTNNALLNNLSKSDLLELKRLLASLDNKIDSKIKKKIKPIKKKVL